MVRMAAASAALARWFHSVVAPPRYKAPARPLRLSAADGTRLHAIVLPGPRDPRRVIVLSHGFTNSSRTPEVHAFAARLARSATVVVVDLRGHGASHGRSTLGHDEPLDVAAALDAARALAPGRAVVAIGISLGGTSSLVAAGRYGGVAAVVALCAPAWRDRSRPGADRVERWCASTSGRVLVRALSRTRVAPRTPPLDDIASSVAAIAPAPVIIVHDPADEFFGPEHATALLDWAREPKELWWAPGAGHGRRMLTNELADRIVARLDALSDG